MTEQNENVEIYQEALVKAKNALSRVDKKLIKKLNTESVPKSAQYDWFNNTSFNNIVYPRNKIPDNLLRQVERRNGIVGAIITLRIQQALEFCNVSHDKDVPGWEIVLKDDKKSPNAQQKKQKEFLENFLTQGHADDYSPIEHSHDDFRGIITKYVRDRILIDKICWEIERNKKGEALALWVVDGATVQPVLPGGFYGSASQVGFGIAWGQNKITEAIRQAKLDQIPPVEQIAYIQENIYGAAGGGVTAAFTVNDLIYDLANELNDIHYYKQGMSVTEKANLAIIAFINSLTFNSNGLSRGAIPKVALAMGKDSQYTQEQLEDMQDEWSANFESMDGQWNIPILNGDAKILNMLPTNRDMEYQKYMEFTGALTCSIMGVDAAELGLRLNQAQQVMSENSDAKQLFSKNRGVREMLGNFAYIANKFLRMSGYDFAKDFTFRFNGLSTEDKNFEADLRQKNVKVFKTVNEIRQENDLKPIDGGDIILDPTYLQNIQAQQMDGGDEGGGESDDYDFSEDETDEMVDEAVDEAMEGLEKAVRLI